jgi:hypothetical protein
MKTKVQIAAGPPAAQALAPAFSMAKTFAPALSMAKAPAPAVPTATARVYCPSCTHTVSARVTQFTKPVKVVAGQKCSRCNAALDAAAFLYLWEAA